MAGGRRTGRRRRRVLDGRHQLELVFGPSPRYGSWFDNDDERRAAWEQHRETLMANHRHGFRPFGWWLHDAPEQRRAGESEAACLYRTVAGAEERAAIEANWRKSLLWALDASHARTGEPEPTTEAGLLARYARDVPAWFAAQELAKRKK